MSHECVLVVSSNVVIQKLFSDLAASADVCVDIADNLIIAAEMARQDRSAPVVVDLTTREREISGRAFAATLRRTCPERVLVGVLSDGDGRRAYKDRHPMFDMIVTPEGVDCTLIHLLYVKRDLRRASRRMSSSVETQDALALAAA